MTRGNDKSKNYSMHQIGPVTKIGHLLNAQDEEEKSKMSDTRSTPQTSTLASENLNLPEDVSEGQNSRKKHKPNPSAEGEKLHTVQSENFSGIDNSKNPCGTSHSRPFDFEQMIGTRLLEQALPHPTKKFHERSGLYYDLSPGSVPVFKATREQIPDPIVFYEAVRELGTEYGCIKLILCDTDQFNLYDRRDSYGKFGDNPDQFWFRATTQYSNSVDARNDNILKFYEALLEFHEKEKKTGSGLNKVPTINKRVLDLYKLWHCVKLRGGYDTVCQEKLWAQIGRELGYSGRIMSSLSTSLRLAYAKVLLGYEQKLREQSRQNHSSGESSQALPFTKSSTDCRDGQGTYKMAYSASEYKILRDLKSAKGFVTNFDSLTEAREGFTEKTDHTLPNYDFNFWQSGLEIFDNDKSISQASAVYNLRQYYEKSEKHFEYMCSKWTKISPKLRDNFREYTQSNFQHLLYDVLSSDQISFSVDTGMTLDSATHNFGSFLIPKNKKKLSAFCDPWNLENIPLQGGSLIQHLDIDFRNYARTSIDVGMLFSVQGWHLNGNFLPSISYNHLGSSKLFQVIPSEHLTKFEELIEVLNNNWEASCENDISSHLTSEPLKASEFHKCYAESILSAGSHRWVPPNSKIFSKDYTKDNPSKRLPGDLQINPEVLKRNGIPLLNVCQEPGSYIFTFPKTYVSTIASGFYVSENASFAPSSWLKYLSEGSSWLQQNGLLPGVLPFQFLLNITLGVKETTTTEKAKEILKTWIEEELKIRAKVRFLLGDSSDIENKFDYISDESLKPTGGSKVILMDSFGDRTLAPDEFLEFIKKEREASFNTDQKSDQSVLCKAQLHVYCPDETLIRILESTSDYDNHCDQDLDEKTYGEFRAMLNDVLEGEKTTLACVEKLAAKVERSKFPLLELKNLLSEAKLLQRDCLAILSQSADQNADAMTFGDGLNLVEPQIVHGQLDLDHLSSILKRIEKSFVMSPPMLRVKELKGRVETFRYQLQDALKSKRLSDLEDAYVTGVSLNLKRKYLQPLAFFMCRIKWLNSYELLINNGDSQLSAKWKIDDLFSFLNHGIKYCGFSHIEKLQKVKEKLVKSQEVISSMNNLINNKPAQLIFPVKDVSEIYNTTCKENLPIDSDLIGALASILGRLNEVKGKITPLQEIIDVNQNISHQLIELIKGNSKEALNYLPNFNGSDNDRRILMSDVADQKFFMRKARACRNWLNKVNKVFNKSKREKFFNQISRVLDVEHDVLHAKDAATSVTKHDIYCFCRQGDIGGTMIECEICKEWYHTECISSGTWELPQDPSNVFVCSICFQGENDANDNGIEYQMIENLVIESVSLKLISNRHILNELFAIFQILFLFKIAMLQDLFASQSTIAENVSLSQMKHYLRKLAKSGCTLSPWVHVITNHCSLKNQSLLEALRAQHLTISVEPNKTDKASQPPQSKKAQEIKSEFPHIEDASEASDAT